MPTPILMPALSPTMEEGKLAKWHVKEGDRVASGDVIAEIETDKATMEVEAVDEGTIGRVLIAEGTEHVKVNEAIALLLGEDEDPDASVTSPQRGDVGAPYAPGEGAAHVSDSESPSPQPSPQRGEGANLATAMPSFTVPHPEEGAQAPVSKGEANPPQRDEGAIPATAVPSFTSPLRREGGAPCAAGEGARKPNGRDRILASPLAKRLARERGINLSQIAGSGPHGRIVKRDIEAAEASQAAVVESRGQRDLVRAPRGDTARSADARVPAISDEQVLALYEPGSYQLVPHDKMRHVIAERLTLAKQTIPHFYLSIDCELDALLGARERLNAMAPKDGPRSFKLSVNDFIIKALAMALQKVPHANATWTEQGLLMHRASDVAVAVALHNGGLFTPVIRNAEMKSLSEISNEMRDLASRARSKRLAPHEYQGGSTAISNLGMYGIARFDAVINPPHASILAVGRAEKRPVIKDDAVKIAQMMSVTLSVDHRVIDGALGAELLAAFKAFIEDPVTMLV